MEDTKYFELLNNIFNKAIACNGFNTICTLLRVGGMSDANWDSIEESRDAFEDFNWFLDISEEKRSIRCKIRVALLMYCQLVEMTAPHEILMNMLNCSHTERYSINPFGHLGRNKKNVPFSYVPPSA